jgi:hypothetical protein
MRFVLAFLLLSLAACSTAVAGRVVDERTNEPLENVHFRICSPDLILGDEVGTSGPDGAYELVLPWNAQERAVWVLLTREGYRPKRYPASALPEAGAGDFTKRWEGRNRWMEPLVLVREGRAP